MTPSMAAISLALSAESRVARLPMVAGWTTRSALRDLLISSEVEDWKEAASVAPAHTRAIPTMRAPEVLAVRRGLWTMLRTARRPAGRSSRKGSPSTATTGRARVGETMSSPRTVPPAPSPMMRPRCVRSAFTHAAAIAAAPAASSSPPRIVRSTRDFSREPDTPRMASTGWVRAASRAGSRAPTTVTASPTASEIAMIVPLRPVPSSSGMPAASSSADNPASSPAPAATPRVEPTTPMTTACRNTTPNTEPGEAPTARRRANSLTR